MLLWPGLLGGIQDQHQPPLPCMRKEKSQPCITEQGKMENVIGSKHILPLERRCLRERSGKDQDSDMSLHPEQSGLQSSPGSGINHPCEGQDLHFNGIMWQRQKPGSVAHCYLAFAHIVYMQASHILPLTKWLCCARHILKIMSRGILKICLGFPGI